MPYIRVDPSSVLDWQHDWDPWLSLEGSPGDAIASRQWTISPQEGSPPQPSLTNPTSAVVMVEGMIPGRVYHLTEHVVTENGLEDDQTIVLRADQG